MSAENLTDQLETWFIRGDYNASGDRARCILLRLLCIPKDEWPILASQELLHLLDAEGKIVFTEQGLRLLTAIEGDVKSEPDLALWRSFRVLHAPVPSAVWQAFWSDFASNDALRHSNAAAVVAPALERHDQYYVSMVRRILSETPIDDLDTTQRLRELLDRFGLS